MNKIRVAHIGTGAAGKFALRHILTNKNLELVGVHVHSTEKVGVDAGLLCGGDLAGIYATDDIDAVLRQNPECISYCPKGSGRELEAANEVAVFLKRGINVVSHSFLSLHYPESSSSDIKKIIENSCLEGKASFYSTGVEPGVMSGQMALAALSFAGDVSRVTITEFGNPTHYGVEEVARQSMGFGMPKDYVPPRFINAALMAWWQPVIDFLADEMDVAIEDYKFHWDTALATKDINTDFGLVEAGTIGATYWEIQGLVNGKPGVVLRHVSSLGETCKPEWPEWPAVQHNAYEVKVEGSLNYCVSVNMDYNEASDIDYTVATTATHVVNAIPNVVSAAPGMLNQKTVGIYTSINTSKMTKT